MPTAETLSNQIRSFIPEDSVDIVVRWITDYKITLTITHSRQSVFGDYRWPQQNKGHRISVNGDLNSYAFLITLVHEMAHLTAWEKFRNTVSSHGKEWKHEYKTLMDEFAGRRIFPADIRSAFKQHLVMPTHSHSIDETLMKVLRKYDKVIGNYLSDLEEGNLFEFQGRVYRKGKKLRKRFKCVEVKTHREYLFNPIAEVKKINEILL
ncbi:MAG TPA: SprT-like domain-containing protein [Chitinophagales bacterium]|nr:SprT-like domain-containing protein [Chitinophagales bacterium]